MEGASLGQKRGKVHSAQSAFQGNRLDKLSERVTFEMFFSDLFIISIGCIEIFIPGVTLSIVARPLTA